jgi:hypothetical protein
LFEVEFVAYFDFALFRGNSTQWVGKVFKSCVLTWEFCGWLSGVGGTLFCGKADFLAGMEGRKARASAGWALWFPPFAGAAKDGAPAPVGGYKT